MTTKYTEERLSEAVANSQSIAGVLRFLGLKQAGGTQAYISRRIKEYGIITEHFTGQASNRGKPSLKRKTADQILIVLPEGSRRPKLSQLKRAMKESGLQEVCSCGIIDTWNGKPIVLEVDHIDGDWLNNNLDNLRFICPNCHSQEATTNMPHKYRIK